MPETMPITWEEWKKLLMPDPKPSGLQTDEEIAEMVRQIQSHSAAAHLGWKEQAGLFAKALREVQARTLRWAADLPCGCCVVSPTRPHAECTHAGKLREAAREAQEE